MLVAELRYVGSWLWIFGALLGSIGLAVGIRQAENFWASAATGLAFAVICASGFASVVLWLRYRRKAQPATSARYGPIVLPHWSRGVDSFAIFCAMAAAFAWLTVSDYRARYFNR